MAYFPSCETGTYISTIIFIQLYICTDTCPYYILQGQTGQQRPGDSMTLLLIWLSDGVAAKTSVSRSKNMVPHMANADESDDTPLRPFKFGCAIVFWIYLASMDWSKGRLIAQQAIVKLLKTYRCPEEFTFNQFWDRCIIMCIYIYDPVIQHVQIQMMRSMNGQFLDGKHKHMDIAVDIPPILQCTTQVPSTVCLTTSSYSYPNA